MTSEHQPRTHLGIDPRLCGTPVALGDGTAEVRLETHAEMAVDDRGLIHGGFVFGLADYAAMLAVNDPYVVLGAAECRFERPVAVGASLLARAEVKKHAGIRSQVEAKVYREGKDEPVFRGSFTCFVLDRHVLDG